jgi:hypothetical protein
MEKKILCGDLEHYKYAINTVTQLKISKFPSETIASFYGLDVIESPLVPKNRALLMSKDGKILQIYDLPDFVREETPSFTPLNL